MNTLIDDIRKWSEKKLYIYGAGICGCNAFKKLDSNKINVSGFIQTTVNEEKTVYGKKVYSINDIPLADDIGILVAVNNKNRNEILENLERLGWTEQNIIVVQNEVKGERFVTTPLMEITTIIGCRIACRYCPQNVFVKEYFKNNKERQKAMSLDTFDILLEKLPGNAIVAFSGMAEPFLNKDCMEMIRKAINSKRKVHLYTTLEGLELEEVHELIQLPIDFVTLHVADKNGYAKIRTGEEYYRKVEVIMNAKKNDGNLFVNVCSSQGDPDVRVLKICGERFEISTTLFDRAGNLTDEELLSSHNMKGKLRCSLCGDNLNRNVVLPDGTVLLCCMDYSMKHVLGNLKDMSYEQIVDSDEMQKIRKGTAGDERVEILCRNCSCAYSDI